MQQQKMICEQRKPNSQSLSPCFFSFLSLQSMQLKSVFGTRDWLGNPADRRWVGVNVVSLVAVFPRCSFSCGTRLNSSSCNSILGLIYKLWRGSYYSYPCFICDEEKLCVRVLGVSCCLKFQESPGINSFSGNPFPVPGIYHLFLSFVHQLFISCLVD